MRRIYLWIIFVGFIGSLLVSSCGKKVEKVKGVEVILKVGKVKYAQSLAEIDKGKEAEVGNIIPEGYFVKTYEKSLCNIAIDEDKIVSIDENTVVEIKRIKSEVGGNIWSEVQVNSGLAVSKIKKKLVKEMVVIGSENTIAAVRGTTFAVKQTSNSSEVIVKEGTVAVAPNIQVKGLTKADLIEKLSYKVESGQKAQMTKEDKEKIEKTVQEKLAKGESIEEISKGIQEEMKGKVKNAEESELKEIEKKVEGKTEKEGEKGSSIKNEKKEVEGEKKEKESSIKNEKEEKELEKALEETKERATGGKETRAEQEMKKVEEKPVEKVVEEKAKETKEKYQGEIGKKIEEKTKEAEKKVEEIEQIKEEELLKKATEIKEKFKGKK